MDKELETHNVRLINRLPGEEKDGPRWKTKDAVLVEDLRELIEKEIADFEDAIFQAPKTDLVELKAGKRALQDLLKQIPREDSLEKSGDEQNE